jgi:hypothetical protein
MSFLPRWLKIVFWVFLGLGLTSWIVWFFLPESKSSDLSRAYSSKIDIVSDIPGFTVEKKNMEQFYEYLREWRIFDGEKRLLLYEDSQFVTPQKITFHLTDQEQPYNKIYIKNTENGEKIHYKSIGEKWDEKTKNLDIFLFINPGFFDNRDITELIKVFNHLVLFSLYIRAYHSENVNIAYQRMEDTNNLISNNKSIFILKKK